MSNSMPEFLYDISRHSTTFHYHCIQVRGWHLFLGIMSLRVVRTFELCVQTHEHGGDKSAFGQCRHGGHFPVF